MRLATFNLENLGTRSGPNPPLDDRIAILRPQIERLRADVLCLQEVNAERLPGQRDRSLHALERLLEGTRYEHYTRVTSHRAGTQAAADVHNLVILSRWPIVASRDIWHDLVERPAHRSVTARPPTGHAEVVEITRPALLADIALDDGRTLTVINAHLQAPRASLVAGQKLSTRAWATTSGWAEGYYLASLKRNLQALELRLTIDRILDAAPDRWLAVAGDLNAEGDDTALEILKADVDDTGNAALAARMLTAVEQTIPEERRFSVLHGSRRRLLDHILVTQPLMTRLRSVDIDNAALADEAPPPTCTDDPEVRDPPLGSFHAPIVAEFGVD